jgi:hypothetical protein
MDMPKAKKSVSNKKPGKLYFKIKECIFHRTVHVFLNYSNAQYNVWLKQHVTKLGGTVVSEAREEFDDNFDAFSSSWDVKGHPSEWAVSVQDFDWTIQDQGTLIHELVHTIIKIWGFNNIPVSEDSQEFFAYSVGNMYKDIAHEIFKRTKRIKK